MTFETFLFDLDGTLIDSVADLATAVNLLRGELDLPPLEIATVRSYVGDGATMLVRRALPEELYHETRLHRFLAHYREHLQESTLVYPGIRPFLSMHRHRKLAVVTNKPLEFAEKLLDGLGLSEFFAVVVGGESCARKKPAPDQLLLALRRLGSDPATAVMIGDHHTDLKAGRAAAVKTCFCAWGLGHDGGIACDFRAATPDQLARLFPEEPR